MNPAPTYDLGRLHGGMRLQPAKASSTGGPLRVMPVPSQLVIPLAQHSGDPAQPLVDIGEDVLKGQLIAAADGVLSAPVHASSSGRVVAIEPWPVSRRYGEPAPCIVIETDGEDRPVAPTEDWPLWDSLDRESLFSRILQGGIVGLGGAVFPTAQKLMQAAGAQLEYLLVNGVECEPYIACDDVLMREFPGDVLEGARVLMHALEIPRCYVALESGRGKPHVRPRCRH